MKLYFLQHTAGHLNYNSVQAVLSDRVMVLGVNAELTI